MAGGRPGEGVTWLDLDAFPTFARNWGARDPGIREVTQIRPGSRWGMVVFSTLAGLYRYEEGPFVNYGGGWPASLDYRKAPTTNGRNCLVSGPGTYVAR